jgi:general secretion pathway protein K
VVQLKGKGPVEAQQPMEQALEEIQMSIKKIIHSERGIALMMVMTAMILLMAIWGEFTFESKISRIKTVNILDKAQSKLLAESGMQMAMTRLRLFKEANNYLENNKAAKDAVPKQLLNQVWEVPYMYPLPVGKDASRTFKDAAEKFQDESIIEGEMRVTIQNISNRLNLNVLRYDIMKNPKLATGEEQPNFTLRSTNDTANPSMPDAIFAHLSKLIMDKKEEDEAFANKYSRLEPETLLAYIQHFTSDKAIMRNDMNPDVERGFENIDMTPKYGPLTSQSELYMMPGWPDELVDLITQEFSIYPNNVIDLNKINKSMLRLLIPQIDEAQMTDFFEYRDNPDMPRFFNTLEEFRKYITQIGRVMDESAFDQRFELLQKLGIEFGASPQMFRIVSEGIYNRSTYTLIATVYLPKQKSGAGTTPPPNETEEQRKQREAEASKQSSQLLEPRIIEIQIN